MTANFGKYVGFICRRERIASLIWIAAVTVSVVVFASLYPGMLPDQEAILGYQAMLDVPTMAAIMGPGYGKEALTPAIVMSHECSIWFAIAVIAMNISFVNRHTRKDEELGRFEMLSALPVGRLSGSLAAVTSAFVLNAVIYGCFGGWPHCAQYRGDDGGGRVRLHAVVRGAGFPFRRGDVACGAAVLHRPRKLGRRFRRHGRLVYAPGLRRRAQ